MIIRLLVDCHHFDEDLPQGITSYLYALYSNVIPQAPDIEFLLVAADTGKLRKIFGDHPNVRYIPLRTRGRYLRLMVELPRLIRLHKADWAHFQYASPRVKACRYVVTLHDLIYEDFKNFFPLSYRLPRHFLFRKSAQMADLVLTVSEYSARRIKALYGVPEDKIHLLPNSVIPEWYEIDREASKKYIREHHGIDRLILYVSRIERRKNHASLLRAYRRLELWRRGLHLVFVGGRTQEVPEFNREWDTMPAGMIPYVHHFDNVPTNELRKWYGAADYFVYPSMAEGFGIPPLEAAAALVPTLCSSRTALADFNFFAPFHIDVCKEGGDHPDDDTLCAALREFLDNPGLADVEAVRDAVRARYDSSRIAAAFIALLRSATR